MIYVYCPRASNGAKELVAWLNAHGGKALRVKNEQRLGRPAASDLVLAWGQRLPVIPSKCLILNAKAPVGNKLVELKKMQDAGVLVPKFSLTPVKGWYARRTHHQAADDLLANLTRGDYYVEPQETTHEFRVHIFGEAPFRTGVKVPNKVRYHPVFRTSEGGWGLTYDQPKLDATRIDRKSIRKVAASAIKALGYDFGAVDIAVRKDGHPVVFEVNSAPGLEGNTIERYGMRILEVAQGGGNSK